MEKQTKFIDNTDEIINIAEYITKLIKTYQLGKKESFREETISVIVDYKYFLSALEQLFEMLAIYTNKKNILIFDKFDFENNALILKFLINDGHSINLKKVYLRLGFAIKVFNLHGMKFIIFKKSPNLEVQLSFPTYRILT